MLSVAKHLPKYLAEAYLFYQGDPWLSLRMTTLL
jgi:hypothetical protein